jgi:hypothetical protein
MAWLVDDPYGREPERYDTRKEAEARANELNEDRQSWNHGQGPNWPLIVTEAD